jgi:uncharacterized membrane protein YhaH (DUF805 family)
LQKYADFSDRARRTEYWMFVLFNIIISIVLGIVDSMAGLRLGATAQGGGVGILGLIYSLGVLIPGIAVGVRRLHDTGRSGLWLLIAFVPCIGAIVLLVFMIQDSMPGTNEYGPNPKSEPAS